MLDTEWKRTHMKSGTLETWLDIIFAASRSCFHLNLRISSIHSSGERQDQAALYPCSTKTREVLGNPSPTTVRFPKTREISRGRSPGDISRAEGNLEVGGDGDVQPNSSRFEAVYGHSLIINPSLGMYQEIHPCRASSTYSVKINTSLPMMREWVVHPQ